MYEGFGYPLLGVIAFVNFGSGLRFFFVISSRNFNTGALRAVFVCLSQFE